MSYSIAKLKRDAKEGKILAECVVRSGIVIDKDNPLPLHIQGKRRIVDSNSVSIFFEIPESQRAELLNKKQTKSECRIPRSNLVEYTDEYLILYRPGYRKPTEREKRLLEEAKDKSYWDKKWFLMENNAEYLMGYEEKRGLKFDRNAFNSGSEAYIRDANIRGTVDFKYLLTREV